MGLTLGNKYPQIGLAVKKKYGDDFYARIGALGGKASNNGGFASRLKCDGSCELDHILGLDHRKAQCAGYKGGTISRRPKKGDK